MAAEEAKSLGDDESHHETNSAANPSFGWGGPGGWANQARG